MLAFHNQIVITLSNEKKNGTRCVLEKVLLRARFYITF